LGLSGGGCEDEEEAEMLEVVVSAGMRAWSSERASEFVGCSFRIARRSDDFLSSEYFHHA
jgi:hypothetical protein